MITTFRQLTDALSPDLYRETTAPFILRTARNLLKTKNSVNSQILFLLKYLFNEDIIPFIIKNRPLIIYML